MREVRRFGIPHTNFQIAPDRIGILFGEHASLGMFNRFAREIDRDGNLLTAQERGTIYHGFEGFLPRLQAAMIAQFGAETEIGQQRITQFFSHVNLQRVLVIRKDRYSQIIRESPQNLGQYTNDFGGVIFIREIPESEQPNARLREEAYNRVFLEEVLHMFLAKVDLPIHTRLLKAARLIVHGAKGLAYKDEPEEHIVSAMIERLSPTLFPQSNVHENSADVARGNGLIAKVGWQFILEGRY